MTRESKGKLVINLTYPALKVLCFLPWPTICNMFLVWSPDDGTDLNYASQFDHRFSYSHLGASGKVDHTTSANVDSNLPRCRPASYGRRSTSTFERTFCLSINAIFTCTQSFFFFYPAHENKMRLYFFT